MGRPNKLQQLAAARGKSEKWYIDHVVAPMVNSKGQAEAAREIGVSQATISGWLKAYNYIPRLDWVLKMTKEDEESINRAVARHEAWEKEQQDQETEQWEFDPQESL